MSAKTALSETIEKNYSFKIVICGELVLRPMEKPVIVANSK